MLKMSACAESFCNCASEPCLLVPFLIWWVLMVADGLLVGTASSSFDTQQTFHHLLKNPAEISFTKCELAFLDDDTSASGAEGTKSQWVTSCLWLTPVLNIVHNVAQFRAFDINKILLSLIEHFFPNHILCYWLYWSKPAKWVLN